MKYFVGYPRATEDSGGFDTSPSGWIQRATVALRPPDDRWIEAGDEVFLIGRGRAEACLVSHIIVGDVRPRNEGPEIIHDQAHVLPGIPIPREIARDLPPLEEGNHGKWLLPLYPEFGRRLHELSQQYLDSKPSRLSMGRTRKRAARERTPEQYAKVIEKKAASRLGQSRFRNNLITVYGCCAISGCTVEDALSAAHIWDYRDSGCQEIWNGILLRADLHLLFDRHLLRIFPGNPPIVVLDEEIREVEEYKRFEKEITPPNPFDERRTNDVLRQRWEAVNRAKKRFPDPVKRGESK